ncbi:hypothetical protein PG991_012231 [Apiospora marii]|uniref:Aminoglycoside phosphotransferase domain-containing protein n=1 Tax=Apiospora marii TaxID=335849 RepID=A0ABR1RA60_9PEZI
MPSKLRYVCMDKDDMIWEKLDEAVEQCEQTLRKATTCKEVKRLILQYRPGEVRGLHEPVKGTYNFVYRLKYEDGSSALMRVPIPGVVPFPEEKIRYEVATMRYVAAHTTIPVPHVYHHGTAAAFPSGLGPFIIMVHIDHHQNMSRELLDPERDEERPILDPNVSEVKSELLYGQMSILPTKTYTSSDEWYRALADLHMAQLVLQHNDAVLDEDDARVKYVARQVRLFSEDLRPANVLLDKDLRVVVVIGWESVYAAPPNSATTRPSGCSYGNRRTGPTFLRVLEREEQKMEGKESSSNSNRLVDDDGEAKPQLLSQRMRES